MVRKIAAWSAGRPWAAGLAVLGSLTCSGDSLGPVPQITSIVLSPALDTLVALGDERAVSVQAFRGTQPYAGGAYTWTLSDTGVVYLAADESKYVTGTELTIDGGALCHQALPELDFEGMRAE